VIPEVPTLTPRDLSLSARVGFAMKGFYRMLDITDCAGRRFIYLCFV
jgi:hypothetical protein